MLWVSVVDAGVVDALHIVFIVNVVFSVICVVHLVSRRHLLGFFSSDPLSLNFRMLLSDLIGLYLSVVISDRPLRETNTLIVVVLAGRASLQYHTLLLEFFVRGWPSPFFAFFRAFGAGYDSFSAWRVCKLRHKFVALSRRLTMETVGWMHSILLTNVIIGLGVSENAFGNDVGSSFYRLRRLLFKYRDDRKSACVLWNVGERSLRIIHIRFEGPFTAAQLRFLPYFLNMFNWGRVNRRDHTNRLIALLLLLYR